MEMSSFDLFTGHHVCRLSLWSCSFLFKLLLQFSIWLDTISVEYFMILLYCCCYPVSCLFFLIILQEFWPFSTSPFELWLSLAYALLSLSGLNRPIIWECILREFKNAVLHLALSWKALGQFEWLNSGPEKFRFKFTDNRTILEQNF